MFKNFIKGLVVGGTISGVTTLLLAPKKGSELRKDAKQRIDDDINLVTTFIGDLEATQIALERFNDSLSLLPDAQNEIDEAITGYEFQAEPRMEQINERIETIQNKLEN